jgi:hypothetical protein
MLKMYNTSNNFDSSLALQKSLARLDYKKPTNSIIVGPNSRVSSSSKNSSLTSSNTAAAMEYDKRLATLQSSGTKIANLSTHTKPPLQHGVINYPSQYGNKSINTYNNNNNNSSLPSKFHVDDNYNGSDMDTMRQLEGSSMSRKNKYNDYNEYDNKYNEVKTTARINFDENSRSSFNNNNNANITSNVAEAVVSSSKVNKNYLLKMKRKFKRKISANVSGTKFEIGNCVLF